MKLKTSKKKKKALYIIQTSTILNKIKKILNKDNIKKKTSTTQIPSSICSIISHMSDGIISITC